MIKMAMSRLLNLSFFFVLIIFFTVGNSAKLPDGHGNSGGLKLQLIHRHDLQRKWPNGPQPVAQLDRIKQLFHSDTIRLRGISQKVRAKQGNVYDSIGRKFEENDGYHLDCNNGRTGYNASGELPMHSAADYGIGQYFVKFRVGSPAQKFVLIADTGSDLTWMNCRYRCRGARCKRNQRKHRVFRADRSWSFRAVPCSSSMCKIDLSNLFSLARCPSPFYPCSFDYRYSDGSAALGLFGHETVTLSLTNGRKKRLHHVLVGCSVSSSGQSFQAADGVMGLGYSNHSFGLKAANKFGGKFSYCLVDHLSPKNLSSYLIFGSHDHVDISLDRMRYTELVLGVINPFYGVKMEGISIGGSMLQIPAETWNVSGGGGVIVDSGSSLTGLTRPAYQPVMGALKRSVVGFEKLDLDIGPLEYCFNSSGFDEQIVPRLVFHFADGARFEPPVKSYVIDAAPSVKCLGFLPLAWPGPSVIGNIMQQNYFWEFDLANGRLGFASSSCN